VTNVTKVKKTMFVKGVSGNPNGRKKKPVGQLTPKGKDFQFAEKQVKEMNKIVNSYLALAQKVAKKETLTAQELVAFKYLEKFVMKAMDKLHANKQDLHIDGEVPIIIL